MTVPTETTDDADLARWMPADQIPLYLAAVAAIKALQAVRQESGLETVWWLYGCPMRMTKASYQSLYGEKEVWTVVVEHPSYAEGAERRKKARRGR